MLLLAAYNGLVFILAVPGDYQPLVTTGYIGAGALMSAVWMVVAYRSGFGRGRPPTQPVA